MPPSESSEAPDQSGLPDGGSVSGPLDADADDEDRAILAQLTIGATVDGKYRVESVLGRGAMGVVVQATHVHLGEKVALKFLRYKARSGTEDFQQRFQREARVSAKLKNEHITRVIDVGLWKDRVPYMVMDHLDGSDLRELIKKQGPLPIGVAIDYAVQVCVGIAEAHAHGIVHRDLKPSNLFLTRRPDGSDLLKILDFGISKWRAGETELDELTQTGVVLGSPKYMAPEQLFGSSEVDARADVWSIGAILYEMLGGRPPFDLPTFTRICAELSTDHPPPSLLDKRPDVTPDLEAVIMKCFLRDPTQRTHDVAELAGSLLEAVQAPFAAPMRQKIASMLDPTSASLLTSSGGMAPMSSGAYGPAMTSGAFATLSATGSGPRGGSTGSGPQTAGSRSANGAQLLEPEPPRRRGALLPGLIAGGVLVLGVLGYLALSGHAEHEATGGVAQGTGAAPLGVAPPSPPAQAALQVGASASAAPSASAMASAAPLASAARPPAPVAPVAPAQQGRAGWRPSPRPPGPPPQNAVAAQTSPPQTSPTPPAPAPPPTATSKADPLGDRQ